MVSVLTVFDCKHEMPIEVDIDDDVQVPESVRGLGKCPECQAPLRLIAISGVAPQPGGRTVVLDSIQMMPI